MTQTKSDGIKHTAEICQESQERVKEIVTTFLDWILDSALHGTTVKVHRFGVFFPKTRKRQIMRNPRTQEETLASKMRSVRFSPSVTYGKYRFILEEE